MSTENLPKIQEDFSAIEQVIIQGDLAKLDSRQRVQYYNKLCDSLGLNPYTKPFEYILLSGKLTLYARKDAAEQLRKINGISVESLDDKMIDDIYVVTAKVKDKNGRVDQAKGAVAIGHLKGEAKANAIMKTETKAKRRATLSISGLGFIDETEVESIPAAEKVKVDHSTGEIEVIPEKINRTSPKPEVKESAPTLKSTNKESTQKNDTYLLHEETDTDLYQEPKLSSDQHRQILEGLQAVDEKFKANFEKYRNDEWNAKDIENIPQIQFEKCMHWIQRNINFNKDQKCPV